MIEFIAGFASGAIVSAALCWQVHRSFIARVNYHHETESLALSLEKRREAMDSDRDSQVPAEAGPAAQQSELFSTRPGALHLHHLAIKNPKNIARSLGLDQNSGIVSGVRVDNDQGQK